MTIDRYIASVTALSPVKVEFKLKEPFGPFLSLFEVSTLPMVPKHVYDGTDFATNPANQTPIGTGPFKFKEWRKGSHIHLVRNEEYWKPGLPHLDELYFRVIPDAASRGVAFERGDVQVLRAATWTMSTSGGCAASPASRRRPRAGRCTPRSPS